MTSRRTFSAALAALGAGTAFPIVAAPASAPGRERLPVLRIGFQKSAVNLVVARQKQLLAQRLPGTELQWLEFPAGPQLLEALSVNAVDFGLTGDTPPVFAQSAGKDLIYVGAEPSKPLSSAIIVPADSPLKTLADLKGKRIAFQKGSSSHYLVVRALDRAGLAWKDFSPIYLPPADARAAFERGAVDAWAIWDPFYAATELAIRPRVLTSGVGLSGNHSFYLASRSLVTDHPGVLPLAFEALTEADRLVQQQRKETVQLIVDFSGLSLATVHLFVSRRPPSPVRALDATMVADQQRVADTFHRLGLIPKPVQVAERVWRPGKPLAPLTAG